MDDERVVGEDTDAYETHWYRVMRSMTDDVGVAEGDAAAEADAARDERAASDGSPEVVVSVAEDRVRG